MKTGKLLVLFIIALAFCALTVVLYQQKKAGNVDSTEWRGKRLFADLGKKADSIRRIEFTKGSDKLLLERGDDDEWRVLSAEGYKADGNRVNGLIFNLTELSISNRVTNDKAKYAKFGVDKDTGTEGALKILGKNNEAILDVVLGKKREAAMDPESQMSGASGNYLRAKPDAYVYMTKSPDLWYLDAKTNRWVDTKIMGVPAEDLTDIKIQFSSATAHLAWDDGALKTTDPIPAGKQQKDTAVQDTRGALAGLLFEDVIGAKSKAAKDIVLSDTFTANAKDGTVYTVKGVQKSGKAYIAVSAAYGEPFFTDDDKATTASMAAAKKKAEEAKKAVDEFNKKQSPWIYVADAYSYSRLFRVPGDFIEEKPKPEPTPTPMTVDVSESSKPSDDEAKAPKPSASGKSSKAKPASKQEK